MHQPHEERQPQRNTLGDFTAGAVFDFCAFLASRPSPLIVGRTYPVDGLMQEFALWAKSRGMADRVVDQQLFREYVDSGKLS